MSKESKRKKVLLGAVYHIRLMSFGLRQWLLFGKIIKTDSLNKKRDTDQPRGMQICLIKMLAED